jgi:hypothetical protein
MSVQERWISLQDDRYKANASFEPQNRDMSSQDWSRREVEAIVDDYLSMLASELAGTSYSKTAHRKLLKPALNSRSDQSIEFKHCNVSAALVDAGFPYISGYKPRFNYQTLVAEVVAERLEARRDLQAIAAADAERPMVVPEVDDILAVLIEAPKARPGLPSAKEPAVPAIRLATNYIEREARNRSLGNAGELFALNYERARLVYEGRDELAGKVEHVARTRGDHLGYDILSFEPSGEERLVEVKTTKYGGDTPFYVTRNEVATSERHAAQYHVYRLFAFRQAPRLYTLSGAINKTCRLSVATYLAVPQ